MSLKPSKINIEEAIENKTLSSFNLEKPPTEEEIKERERAVKFSIQVPKYVLDYLNRFYKEKKGQARSAWVRQLIMDEYTRIRKEAQ